MNCTLYDLLYLDQEDFFKVKNHISKIYPQAVIEDASDCIHGTRMTVEFDIVKKEWLKFVMKSGLHNSSFDFNIVLLDDRELIKEIMREDGIKI